MTSLLIGIGLGTAIGYFLQPNPRRAVDDGYHWPEPDDDEPEEEVVDRETEVS
ncbi:MAG TPA: hypothetical protein VKS01_01060 [Bryobacteraceae bacterium]|nr:hypothetical protein [Bryobacteraceae bacterium]